MQMSDMIMVSIDDHYIEPPDMWDNHVPAKFLDQVPKVVRNQETGVDEWVFQGEATSTPFGMAATVGWPKKEWGFNPGAYIKNTIDFMEPVDVISGLVKAAVFGFIIALMGCYHGFNSKGGAQGVGRATTNAVVSGSILILAANYALTSLLFSE